MTATLTGGLAPKSLPRTTLSNENAAATAVRPVLSDGRCFRLEQPPDEGVGGLVVEPAALIRLLSTLEC